ncbi:MFS transporter [Spongisporangium articulatum]|uniref:MFS transporter n=1 Tax=Spongisporangium articulatum TaxID=3362603 RepID=A0ABW8ALG9_9ACTN
MTALDVLLPRTAAPEGRFDRRLLAPLILGALLNPVNSSMIAVALVPIGLAFGAPPAQTAWLVSGLYLATAVGQPVVGRLVDSFGPRRLYLLGTALTGVAGVLGAFAPNLPTLVIARVVLGFGTCAGFPAAMTMIRREGDRTGDESPAGVLTVLSVSTQTVAVVGPTLGGLLIDVGGWRTLFAVNVPLSLTCLVLGSLYLPREQRDGDRAARAGGAGPALGLLHNAPLVATYVRTLLSYTVSYAFLYGYTQWLEAGRGLSASVAGLALLPVFGVAIVVTTLTGRRPEVWWKLLVGGAAQLAGCLALLTLGASTPVGLVLGVGVIFALPQGLTSLANQNALYHQADRARLGASAGLLRTFMYLGAIVSSAATAVFFDHGIDTAGLHRLALFMAGASALVLFVCLSDPSLRRIGRPAAEPSPERTAP